MDSSILMFLGVLPSGIWLMYFLRKDVHPEPNRMILLVFAAGMGSALVALAIERAVLPVFGGLSSPLSAFTSLFIGVALVEELVKYGAVRFTVLNRRVVDEPIDIPLYFIVAGLGFAALENVLVLMGAGVPWNTPEIAGLSALRFLGAVFLHALVSGMLGYFIVRNRLFAGLCSAVILHGLFNWFILKEQGMFQFAVPALIIGVLATTLVYALGQLKTAK
ncbi:MAG: PrsW family glutamic-type intramembrane protease [bacterium]|nr:PrsW family glutamic-type intramembrane protease [bacterium]